MLNFIAAEFWRMSRKRGALLLWAGFLTLVGLYSLLFTGVDRADYVKLYGGMLLMGLYLGVPLAAMADGGLYRNGTLKNEISFGLSRSEVYLGRLAVGVLTGLAVFGLTAVVFLGLCLAMGSVGDPVAERAAWAMLGREILRALPRWLGGLGLAHALFFLCPVEGMGVVFYYLYITVGELGLDAIQIQNLGGAGELLQSAASTIRPLLLSVGFYNPMSPAWDLVWDWTVGLGWLAATTLVGLTAFQRRDLK